MIREFSISCCYILILLLASVSPTRAGQWGDTFEQKDLLGWSLLSEKIPKDWKPEWKTDRGVLDVTIKSVKHFQIADFLQWTVCPLDAQDLIVVVHSMDAFPINGMPEGKFGVFLGEELPKDQDYFASGYFFSKIFVYPIQFSENGDRKAGDVKAAFVPRLQLQILFQSGHFRLFSGDVFLTEFEDLELERINTIGLLVITNGVADEFHGKVGTFIISGTQIPNNDFVVQPKGRLVTTWSKLKIL